jgi:hypothetical protein
MNGVEILEQNRRQIRLKLAGVLVLCGVVDFIITLALWILDPAAAVLGGLLGGLWLYFYIKFKYFAKFEDNLKGQIRDEILRELGLDLALQELKIDNINSHFDGKITKISEFGLFKFGKFAASDICIRDKDEVIFYGILIRGMVKGNIKPKKEILNSITSYFIDDEILSLYIATDSDTIVANLKTPLNQSYQIAKDNIQSIIKEIKQLEV